MKKSNILAPVSLFVVLAGLTGLMNAAPYGPNGHATRWVQPNGETLELRVFGDEYYGRTETLAGYTVVYDPADGAYHYAELSADATALVPSETLAGAPAPAGQVQHLDLPRERIEEAILANRVKYDGDRQLRWNQRVRAVQQLRAGADGPALRGPTAKPAPLTGNKKGLTILVQFPDDSNTNSSDPINFPASRSKLVRFCNEVGYSDDGNSGSVRDYFSDQSLGKLDYTQVVTQIITMPRARNYYNFSDYPTNRVLRSNASRVLVTDAIAVLQSENFDFTDLTTDENDHAIATNVFFAGPDSGVFANGLWPQQWSLPGPISVGTGSKPVFINKFQITNAENSELVIGTFCHESGHLIVDYPDIYSIFPTGEGVGEHCLMGSGNYLNDGKTPSPINAYFKDIVGWAKITDISPADFRTASLPTRGNVAYRLRNPGASTEFFMVENRGEGDKWANYSNDQGILIWHIDETIDGNLRGGDNYMVSVEQADGRGDLENGLNRGDSSDYFDLVTPKFSDRTSPDANWWDGTRSGIKIEVVTAPGPRTSVLFGGVPPNTIIVGEPNGGEVVYPDSSLEILWQANISGNVKIELYKSGVFKSVIALDEPNDGRYIWVVPESIAGGKNYTIRISSISNPVPAFDFSDAPFEINDTTFPVDARMPFGWFRPNGAATSWQVSKSQAYEGAASLVSRNPGDGQTSAIAYRAAFKAGRVSFYFKVSSEERYDFARFYIDGVAQVLSIGGSTKPGISGGVDWSFVSIPVSAGNHTFKWTYEKDDSYPSGSDRAWLDGVVLPETTQEITVLNRNGEKLVAGESEVSFPAVTIYSPGDSKTFTIKNVGKSALLGLKLTKAGENAGDFTVSSLQKAILEPGESTDFKIRFSPTHVGPLTASVRILSNDEDEGNFKIKLDGTGLGLPEIGVSQADSALKDGKNTIDFGFAVVGTEGKTKTFTIKNKGSAALRNLEISKSGPDRADFQISQPGQTSLSPGATATFKVTFNPKARDGRRASIQILSNDKRSGPFDIAFTGTGAPKSLAASAPNSPAEALGSQLTGSASPLPSLTTLEIIGGRKYLSMTVTKQAGITGNVEVSSNLLDWYSGKKHTTVLIDDATTLKVRDNTPVTPDAKRFIRLR